MNRQASSHGLANYIRRVEHWELVAGRRSAILVAAYAHHADSGRFAEFAELFALDGVLEVAGAEPVRGRDAIRAFVGGARTELAAATTVPIIRHHVSNLMIEVVSPTEATRRVLLPRGHRHGVDHWGRYRDRYLHEDDRWRFEHRYARTDGTTPGGWAAWRQPPG